MAQNKPCPYFLNGHCNKKTKCNYSHIINTCPYSYSCPNLTNCKRRHVKLCPKYLNNTCGFFSKAGQWIEFTTCSFMHEAPLVPPPMYNMSKLQHDLKQAQRKILELERKVVCKAKQDLDANTTTTHDKVMVAVTQDNNTEPDPSHLTRKVQSLESHINNLEQKLKTQEDELNKLKHKNKDADNIFNDLPESEQDIVGKLTK